MTHWENSLWDGWLLHLREKPCIVKLNKPYPKNVLGGVLGNISTWTWSSEGWESFQHSSATRCVSKNTERDTLTSLSRLECHLGLCVLNCVRRPKRHLLASGDWGGGMPPKPSLVWHWRLIGHIYVFLLAKNVLLRANEKFYFIINQEQTTSFALFECSCL